MKADKLTLLNLLAISSFSIACSSNTLPFHGKSAPRNLTSTMSKSQSSADSSLNHKIVSNADRLQILSDKMQQDPEIFEKIKQIRTIDLMNIEVLKATGDTIEFDEYRLSNLDSWRPLLVDLAEVLSEEFPVYGDYLAAIGISQAPVFDKEKYTAYWTSVQALLSNQASEFQFEDSDNPTFDQNTQIQTSENALYLKPSFTRWANRTWNKVKNSNAFKCIKDIGSTALGISSVLNPEIGIAKGVFKKVVQGGGKAYGVEKTVNDGEKKAGELYGTEVPGSARATMDAVEMLPGVGGLASASEGIVNSAKDCGWGKAAYDTLTEHNHVGG